MNDKSNPFEREKDSSAPWKDINFLAVFEKSAASLVIKADPPRFTMLAVSDQYLKMTACKREDLIGKGVFEVFTDNETDPSGALSAFRAFMEVIETRQQVDLPIYKYEIISPASGKLEPFYWSNCNVPILGEDGQVAYILNTTTDITEQILLKEKGEKARLDLALHQQQINEMFVKAPVAIATLMGPRHVVEIANDRILEIWGKSPKQVINKPIFEGLPDAKGQGLEALLANVYTSGQRVVAYERPLELLRNGIMETIYVNFLYEPITEESNRVRGIMVVATEVTDQVLARQRLEENEQRLEKLVEERTRELYTSNEALLRTNQELEQFAYIASHDLQEPLRKIQIFSELLGDNLHSEETAKTYLGKINSSARRMVELIKDVLDYSRLAKKDEQYVPTDLNVIMATVLVDFELMIEQKQASIQLNRLPVIDSIPRQLNQLFSNLLSNSLKFSDKKPAIEISARVLSGPEMDAQLGLRPGVDYAEIIFKDNGIGFEPKYAQQIFTIFRRLNHSKAYSGTGIGLALCKKIVANHQGVVFAESELNEGTTFFIYLPLRHPA
ncbi:hypothetical protein GCM10027275_40190 [Rhabdobacter roseus]|uniref:histidine kinase n=1 Tax=Rhabdobacter roseus TaxID=1655419 RepID=A0A840TN78_9BACT|nr:ATP-binding protein [Rhabdobacter roseus]MBB5285726.1 signal transduction histidine kinase [Rhabdobacter roseus]